MGLLHYIQSQQILSKLEKEANKHTISKEDISEFKKNLELRLSLTRREVVEFERTPTRFGFKSTWKKSDRSPLLYDSVSVDDATIFIYLSKGYNGMVSAGHKCLKPANEIAYLKGEGLYIAEHSEGKVINETIYIPQNFYLPQTHNSDERSFQFR